MNQRSPYIFAIVVITLLSTALALLAPQDLVLIRVVTLPLVLVLPGYALTSALFPNRSLGVPEHLVFSLGLSLTIVILGGFALNLMPFGLRASSWTLLLSSITLGASTVALLRRRGRDRLSVRWIRIRRVDLVRPGLTLGLAALLVCGAVAVSITGAQRQPYPGFTQLWILPAGGNNPKNGVQLGVDNMELTAMAYRLVVKIGSGVVVEWPPIDLNPKEKWVTIYPLPPTTSAGATRVEVDLYRVDAPTTIYRHVVLWLST